MRAISVIFLLLFTVAACTPDLNRQSGSLRVEISGVPQTIENIQIKLQTESSVLTRELTATATPAVQVLIIDSVPVGFVTVTGTLLESGEAKESQEDVVQILEGESTNLTLDFSSSSLPDAGVSSKEDAQGLDSGPQADAGDFPMVYDDTITLSFNGIQKTNLDNGQLTAWARPPSGAYTDFINNARTKLGSTPNRFTFTSVQLTLLANSIGAEGLNDLWTSVSASISNSERANILSIGSTSISTPVKTLDIPPPADQTALSALLTDLQNGTFEVRLSGPVNPPLETQNFTINLQLILSMNGELVP